MKIVNKNFVRGEFFRTNGRRGASRQAKKKRNLTKKRQAEKRGKETANSATTMLDEIKSIFWTQVSAEQSTHHNTQEDISISVMLTQRHTHIEGTGTKRYTSHVGHLGSSDIFNFLYFLQLHCTSLVVRHSVSLTCFPKWKKSIQFCCYFQGSHSTVNTRVESKQTEWRKKERKEWNNVIDIGNVNEDSSLMAHRPRRLSEIGRIDYLVE